MYNEAVEKSCETFCDSVSQKEAEPCFIPHNLLTKYEQFNRNVTPLRSFFLFSMIVGFYMHNSYQMVLLISGGDCNTFDILTVLKMDALTRE